MVVFVPIPDSVMQLLVAMTKIATEPSKDHFPREINSVILYQW
jgi:hypothetical protein